MPTLGFHYSYFKIIKLKEVFIKNMVCDRCVMIVKQHLDAPAIGYSNVQLGDVDLNNPISDDQFETLKDDPARNGF